MKHMKILIVVLALAVASTFADSFEEAAKLIEQKQYAPAETMLLRMQQEITAPRIVYALGFCAEMQGRKEQSIVLYRKAIALYLQSDIDEEWATYASRRLAHLQPGVSTVLDKAEELKAAARKVDGDETQLQRLICAG